MLIKEGILCTFTRYCIVRHFVTNFAFRGMNTTRKIDDHHSIVTKIIFRKSEVAIPYNKSEKSLTMVKCSKSVHFSSANLVHIIPSRNDYTEEEKASCWYGECDVERIRQNMLISIKRLRKGLPDSSRYSSLGLESYISRKRFEDSKLTKDTVVQTVLKEQRLQKRLNKPCSNQIAEASKIFSAWSKIQAIQTAQRMQ